MASAGGVASGGASSGGTSVPIRRVVLVNPVRYGIEEKTAAYPEEYLALEIAAQRKIGQGGDTATFGWFAKNTKAHMSQCEFVYGISRHVGRPAGAFQHTVIAGFDPEYMANPETCNVEPTIALHAKGVVPLLQANDFTEFVNLAIGWIRERACKQPVEIQLVNLPDEGVEAIPEARPDQVVVWMAGSIAKVHGYLGRDWRDTLIHFIAQAQTADALVKHGHEPRGQIRTAAETARENSHDEKGPIVTSAPKARAQSKSPPEEPISITFNLLTFSCTVAAAAIAGFLFGKRFG